VADFRSLWLRYIKVKQTPIHSLEILVLLLIVGPSSYLMSLYMFGLN
jgi:hypothetical protein